VKIIPKCGDTGGFFSAREYALDCLKSIWHGDELIAEICLYTMISRLFTRAMFAGKLSLNVTSPPDDINTIIEGLGQITRLVHIPLTVDGLNKTRFSP
jgi:hypothetical protein